MLDKGEETADGGSRTKCSWLAQPCKLRREGDRGGLHSALLFFTSDASYTYQDILPCKQSLELSDLN